VGTALVNLVHLGVNRWEGLIQREQHLISGLSQTFKVLFIEPPLSFLSHFNLRRKGINLGYKESLKTIHERLYIYSPPALLPFGRSNEIIYRFNSYLLLRKIEYWIKKLSLNEFGLGFSFPFYKKILDHLDYSISYYDVCDDYIHFPSLPFDKEKLRRLEEELLRSVDIVFCSSKGLKEKASLFNKNCLLIPNGVDYSLFEKSYFEEPYDLKRIPKPLIGYIGTLGEWVDGEFLREISQRRRDWSFVLIGPLASKTLSTLRNNSNIYFLGERKYELIPNYLSHFDICLIPFKVNEFTQMICPTKFYQYLASGKPIVSSPLRDLEDFKEVVEFYSTPSEMEEKIEKLLREDRIENQVKRRKLAKENLWQQRVERMTRAIRFTVKL
jgi:hypothetical protein